MLVPGIGEISTEAYMKSIFLLFVLLIAPITAQNVGDPAPDFTLSSLNHGSISLSNYQGKVVFIFFLGFS